MLGFDQADGAFTLILEPNMKHQQRRLPKLFGQSAEEMSPAEPPWRKAVVNKSVADAGENGGKPPGKSLKNSLQQQNRFRLLTHEVLAAQEDERKKISHELQDEIAQALLGINVRLLLLKQAARGKAKGLKNQIVSAQRLVVKSATLVRRLARELDNHQPTPNELKVVSIEAV